MKIITSRWIKPEWKAKGTSYFCVNIKEVEECEGGLRFEKYFGKTSVDADFYVLIRPDFAYISFAESMVKAIEDLKTYGFTLDEKAEKQYQYWLGRYEEEKNIEEERKKEQKLIEQKEKEEREKKQKEAIANLGCDYKLFCDKMGCATTWNHCNKCKWHILQGCRPAMVKVRV